MLAVVGALALQGGRPGTPLWDAVPGQLPGSASVGDAGGVPVTDAPADSRADVAIAFALAQRGTPYVWGGDGPAEGGWDCSGLTKAAYGEAGVELPRVAADQFGAGPHTTTPDDPAPGDLVFYGTPGAIHHVGLALGNGVMVHAPHTGAVVEVSRIRWPGDDYVGATRPAAPGTAVDPGALGDVVVPSGPAPADPAPEGPTVTIVDTPTAATDPVTLAEAATALGGQVPTDPGAPVAPLPVDAAPVPASPAVEPAPVVAPAPEPEPVPSAVVPSPVPPSVPVGTAPGPTTTASPRSPGGAPTTTTVPTTTTTDPTSAPPPTTTTTPAPPTTTTRVTTPAGPVVVRVVTGPSGVTRCLEPPAVDPITLDGVLVRPCPAAPAPS